MARTRITLDVDSDWLAQFVSLDEDGALVFNTEVAELVSVETL